MRYGVALELKYHKFFFSQFFFSIKLKFMIFLDSPVNIRFEENIDFQQKYLQFKTHRSEVSNLKNVNSYLYLTKRKTLSSTICKKNNTTFFCILEALYPFNMRKMSLVYIPTYRKRTTTTIIIRIMLIILFYIL